MPNVKREQAPQHYGIIVIAIELLLMLLLLLLLLISDYNHIVCLVPALEFMRVAVACAVVTRAEKGGGVRWRLSGNGGGDGNAVDEGCTCDDHPCTSLLQSGRAEPWLAPSCELPESAIVRMCTCACACVYEWVCE